MDNEYLSYLKEDTKLYALVNDNLPELQCLSAAQIEKLVFYLKSLHGYYPENGNDVASHLKFSNKLEQLRNSSEQVALQRQAGVAVLKGIVSCVFTGALLVVALAALLDGQMGIGVGLLVAVGACILFADHKLLRKALLLSKEQDRKYSSRRSGLPMLAMSSIGLAFFPTTRRRKLGRTATLTWYGSMLKLVILPADCGPRSTTTNTSNIRPQNSRLPNHPMANLSFH